MNWKIWSVPAGLLGAVLFVGTGRAEDEYGKGTDTKDETGTGTKDETGLDKSDRPGTEKGTGDTSKDLDLGAADWSLKAEIIEVSSEEDLCHVYGKSTETGPGAVKPPADREMDPGTGEMIPKDPETPGTIEPDREGTTPSGPDRTEDDRRPMGVDEPDLNRDTAPGTKEPGMDKVPGSVPGEAAKDEVKFKKCKFVSVVKVIEGNVGGTRLDGVKFALAGNLAREFKPDEQNPLVVTIDPAVTAEQKTAIETLITNLYPVKWTSKVWKTEPITWNLSDDVASVRIGDKNEIMLKAHKENEQAVIRRDMTYWSAKSNEGFRLYDGRVVYKDNDLDYSFDNRRGFSVRIEAGGDVPRKD